MASASASVSHLNETSKRSLIRNGLIVLGVIGGVGYLIGIAAKLYEKKKRCGKCTPKQNTREVFIAGKSIDPTTGAPTESILTVAAADASSFAAQLKGRLATVDEVTKWVAQGLDLSWQAWAAGNDNKLHCVIATADKKVVESTPDAKTGMAAVAIMGEKPTDLPPNIGMLAFSTDRWSFFSQGSAQ